MENDAFDKIDELAEVSSLDDLSETLEPTETSETGLDILAERVTQLARLSERLAWENQALHEQVADLRVERDALFERNEQSRARIEAMIVRLRSLEQTS